MSVSQKNNSHFISEMEGAVRIFLYTSFLIAAINGNVLLFFSLFRYKVLRTVHDALIADFAVVDFLNCVVIIPLSIHFVVLERFHVKSFVWALSFLHSFFILNSLFTLMLQMVDRYLAISFPFTYKAKKSWTKIIAVISFKWFAILTITVCLRPSLPRRYWEINGFSLQKSLCKGNRGSPTEIRCSFFGSNNSHSWSIIT